MTYLLAEVSALVNGQKLASRPAPQRTWRDRANAGAIDLQASAACTLASTLTDENLCDRLQAARILRTWLQGVA